LKLLNIKLLMDWKGLNESTQRTELDDKKSDSLLRQCCVIGCTENDLATFCRIDRNQMYKWNFVFVDYLKKSNSNDVFLWHLTEDKWQVIWGVQISMSTGCTNSYRDTEPSIRRNRFCFFSL
jgi:hypothetical protein